MERLVPTMLPNMLPFEAVTVLCLLGLAVAAPLTRRPAQVTLPVVCVSVAGVALVVLTSRFLPLDARLWAAHAYFALLYWVPGVLARGASSGAFEAWLRRSNVRWERRAEALPLAVRTAAEFTYLLCYPALPAGFVVVWLHGPAAASRYLLTVLLTAFVCFAPLPWLISRPPRRSSGQRDTPMATVNRFVLSHVSHGMNTFPSGHVAVCAAAAWRVADAVPMAGIVMALVAAGVAVGAVTGRHHYAVDVAAGAGVALTVTLIT
jgi:membrane-associated phospholipid phosphatase